MGTQVPPERRVLQEQQDRKAIKEYRVWRVPLELPVLLELQVLPGQQEQQAPLAQPVLQVKQERLGPQELREQRVQPEQQDRKAIKEYRVWRVPPEPPELPVLQEPQAQRVIKVFRAFRV